jgi:hypothetical protein
LSLATKYGDFLSQFLWVQDASRLGIAGVKEEKALSLSARLTLCPAQGKYDGYYYSGACPDAHRTGGCNDFTWCGYSRSGSLASRLVTEAPGLLAKFWLAWRNTVEKNMYMSCGYQRTSGSEQMTSYCNNLSCSNVEEWVAKGRVHQDTFSGCKAYWFDETGINECKLPVSRRMEYWNGGSSMPIRSSANSRYTIAADRWCEITSAPVRTASIRLHLYLKEGWSTGVRQWQVMQEAEDN